MTDEQFQTAVVRALARIEAKQEDTRTTVRKLESAVLGNPNEGVDGLLTRVKVIEEATSKVAENTPGKVKRVVINGGAGLSGGAVVVFLMNEIWPVVKGMLGA